MSLWIELPEGMGGARLGPIAPVGGTLGSDDADDARLPAAFGISRGHAKLWSDAEGQWWIEAREAAWVLPLGDAVPKPLTQPRRVAPGDRYTLGALRGITLVAGRQLLSDGSAGYARRLAAELGLRARALLATFAPARAAAEVWRFLRAGGWRSPAFLVSLAALSLGAGGGLTAWRARLTAEADRERSDAALAHCQDALARSQSEPDGPQDLAGWAALAARAPDLRETLATPTVRAAFTRELQRILAAAPITGWRPGPSEAAARLGPTLHEHGVEEAVAAALIWWAHDPLDPLVRGDQGSLHAVRAAPGPDEASCLRGPWRLDRQAAAALGLQPPLDAAIRSDHPALLPGTPGEQREALVSEALALAAAHLPGRPLDAPQLQRVGATLCMSAAGVDPRDHRTRVAARFAHVVDPSAAGLPKLGEPDAIGSRLGTLIAMSVPSPPQPSTTRATWAALNARDPGAASWWADSLGAALARRVGWPCAAVLEGAPLDAARWGTTPRLDACGAISALARASHP